MKPVTKVSSRDGIIAVRTGLHHYQVQFNRHERQWQIDYHELETDERGNKFTRTVDEALEWIEQIHAPDKLKAFMSKWVR